VNEDFLLLLLLSQILKPLLFKSVGHLISSRASHSVNFADAGAWSWWAEYPFRTGTLKMSQQGRRDKIRGRLNWIGPLQG
jgi:hypothetical protein